MGQGEARLDPQCLSIVTEGRSGLAQCLLAKAEVVKRRGELGLDQERRLESTGRLLKPAQHPLRFGPVSVVGRHSGLHGDRAPDQLLPEQWFPLLHRCQAEQMQRIGVRGVSGEEALVDPRRLIQSAS